MIRFACPCGRDLYGREEDIGRTAQCPGCDAISVIPAASMAEDGIQADRPLRPNRLESREDSVDRPRRPERDLAPPATSGKATAALLFGISAVCLLFTAIPGAIFGMLALRDIGKSNGNLGGRGMAITGLVFSCLSVLLVFPLSIFGVYKVRAAAARMQELNNLMQLTLGMHTLHDSNGTIPQAAAFQNANGKPLLSWRVALLPYIGEDRLYMRFRLDEPWDSPNNKALLPLMPKMYARPGDAPGSGMTHYQGFVGPGTAFEPRKLEQFHPAPRTPMPGWSLAQFTDGPSNTILIATSATPVPWTKPEDMPFDPTGPLPRLGGYLSGGSSVSLVDGSVRFLPETVPDATLRAVITRNGEEVVQLPW
jgi:Protein of unknown function (DUF1559)/Domain of unknown function (DUF4190)